MAQNYANWGWTGSGYAERIYLDVVYVENEIATNRTKFRAKIWNNSNNSYGDTGSLAWTLKDQWGTRRENSSSNKSTTGYNQVVTYDEFDFWINNNDDGSMPNVNFTLNITRALGQVRSAAVSVTVTNIPTIPRASTITSFNDFTIGSNIAWTVDRKYSTYCHKLDLILAGTVIVSEVSSNTSGTLIITQAMKNQMLGLVPSATEIAVTLRVTTYTNINLVTQVGSVQTAIAKAKVGDDIIPSFTTITHSEYVSDVLSKVGAYVQHLSRLNVAITGAAAGTGSSIQSYEIKVAGQTAPVQSATTQVITQSGNLKITGKVTDKRGRSVTKEVTITVLAYAKPTFTSYQVFRSKFNKTFDAFGTYVTVRYIARASSLKVGSTEKNTLQVKVWSRVKGGSWVVKGTYPETSLIPAQREYSYDDYLVTSQYEFRFEITDIFGSATMTDINDENCKIPTGGVPLFVGYGGLASSAGKIPTFGNTYNLEIGAKGLYSEGQIYQNNGVGVRNGYVSDLPAGDVNKGQYWRDLRPGRYFRSGTANGVINTKGDWAIIEVYKARNELAGNAHTRVIWMVQTGAFWTGTCNESAEVMTWNLLDSVASTGSNSNGSWERRTDNKLTQWGIQTISTKINTVTGSLYAVYVALGNFPIAFTELESFMITIMEINFAISGYSLNASTLSSKGNIHLYTHASTGNELIQVRIYWEAKGR